MELNDLFFLGLLILYAFGLGTYAKYKLNQDREWKKRDAERIKRIEETGIYEPQEKPYW